LKGTKDLNPATLLVVDSTEATETQDSASITQQEFAQPVAGSSLTIKNPSSLSVPQDSKLVRNLSIRSKGTGVSSIRRIREANDSQENKMQRSKYVMFQLFTDLY